MSDDCGCIIHDGPHWKYEDDLWRTRNNVLLAIALDPERSPRQRELAYYAYCQEETLRLQEKLWKMRDVGQELSVSEFHWLVLHRPVHRARMFRRKKVKE